ncbi:E3 ubiquitin-protein ligase PDZRN3-B-like [Tautogolabrus adspersus]
MRADCPTSGKENKSNLEPGGMESQTKPELGHGGGGVCQGGCGLRLTGEEHCCVDALRTVTDTLEERSATLEHEARMARLRWNRREQYLLAQVSNLQNEAQLAALQYQQRLHQYMLHINSIAEQVTGYCKGDLRATCDKQSNIADTASCKEEEQQEPLKAAECLS